MDYVESLNTGYFDDNVFIRWDAVYEDVLRISERFFLKLIADYNNLELA